MRLPVTCVEYGLTIKSAFFTLPSMPRTALVVPVREAAPYYAGAPGVPAHVTVLFPFDETPDEQALEDLFRRFHAFDFELDSVEQFAEGTRWLHPSPSAPFVDLTAAVWQRWPDYAPYEGAFDEVIPHLTITVDDVQGLPIRARATEVALLEESESDGSWSVRRTFALGQGVA